MTGEIVITGNEAGTLDDDIRAARSILEWAAQERLEPPKAVARAELSPNPHQSTGESRTITALQTFRSGTSPPLAFQLSRDPIQHSRQKDNAAFIARSLYAAQARAPVRGSPREGSLAGCIWHLLGHRYGYRHLRPIAGGLNDGSLRTCGFCKWIILAGGTQKKVRRCCRDPR